MDSQPSMKSMWFDHVSKTRKKMSKGKQTCTHQNAMKAASTTWPAIRNRIEKKRLKEAKRKTREDKKLIES